MNRYIPTGNERISLPKINEATAGIEDFTYLSMQHKGLIEVRGSENTPLIRPFLTIGGKELPLTRLHWRREHDWIPSLTAKAGDLDFSMVVLDDLGNGYVFTNIHNRDDARCYCKRILNGASKHPLSDEEKEVLEYALNNDVDYSRSSRGTVTVK